MIERIERLRKDPPEHWDGIYAFEEK